MNLQVHTRTEGPVAVVAVGGELDAESAPLFRRIVGEVVDVQAHVVLDMTLVSFLDCRGIGALVDLTDRAAAARGSLVVSGLQPGPLQLLDVFGLRSLLTAEPAMAATAG